MTDVFLHGLGQTPADWKKTLTVLGDGEEAICPDLAGQIAGQATYENLFQGLEKSLRTLTPPFRLCGLSLGAVLALDYASRYPERVSALCLIAPQFRMPRRLLRIQSGVFRLMPERSFGGMGFSKKGMLSLTASMAQLELEEAVDRIRCCTAVVCGEKDRANRRAAEELTQRIPGSRLFLAAGAGHEVNQEAPAFLAGVLREQERWSSGT